MKNITNKTKIFSTTVPILVAIAAIMTVGIVGQHQVEATSVYTYQMVEFEDWSSTDKFSTNRSNVSNMNTDLTAVGEADMYAKDRSYVNNPQASIEYTKDITVEAGDVLEITQYTYLNSVSFYHQDDNTESHLTTFPTIHLVGESSTVGYTNLTGCDNPVFEEITSATTDTQLTSTLLCDTLAAGDYEISAYVHTRANENHASQNASVSATVSDIELSVKRTR